MSNISEKLMKIRDAITPVAPKVFHYWRTNARAPYLIWMEDSEDGSLHADNRKQEQQLHGTVDYFTKMEFDPVVDAVQAALNDITRGAYGWRLTGVQYEEETSLIHYSWEWWVV